MSLKIAATLIIAALVAQTTPFVVKSHQEDTPTTPGFACTIGKTAQHDEISVSAPSGIVDAKLFGFLNQTQWTLSSADDVKTITQKTFLVFVAVLFKNTEVKIGDVTTTVELPALSNNSTYILEISASGKGENCKLTGKIDVLELVPVVNTYVLGESRAVLEQSDVKKELQAVLVKALAPSFADALTKMLNDGLSKLFDGEQVKFCNKLAESSEKDYPQPRLWSTYTH